ncbi:hypothetical protein D3C81_1732230 [compost metagenome]
MARVIALADVIAKQLVLRRDGLERGQRLGLALPFAQLKHAGALDALRDDAVDQAVEAVMADQRQHRVDVVLTRADVTGDELVVGGQRDGCIAHVGPLAQALSARKRS